MLRPTYFGGLNDDSAGVVRRWTLRVALSTALLITAPIHAVITMFSACLLTGRKGFPRYVYLALPVDSQRLIGECGALRRALRHDTAI